MFLLRCRNFAKIVRNPTKSPALGLRQFSEEGAFTAKKVLVLTKMSRYEFEQRSHANLSEAELELTLAKRGSDYHMLLQRHNAHKAVESSLLASLTTAGLSTRVVNRLQYTSDNIDWADVIVTAGGDGTYLLAACKVLNRDKPIIGFNSDPSRSRGQLCLPERYSHDTKEAVHKLMKGQFRWQFRRRIRITVTSADADAPPVELHHQLLNTREHRYLDIDPQQHLFAPDATPRPAITRRLPVLALNEVFMGENVSARVSYLELGLDGAAGTKQKCSGLLVNTGTGSTSWAFNVNRLSAPIVRQLQAVVESKGGSLQPGSWDSLEALTHAFNTSLLYDGEDPRLCYNIRDQLVAPPTHTHPPTAEAPPLLPRGFAEEIHVRSRCFDASLVVDGGLSYPFNDGARVVLSVCPEDALRSVVLT